MNFPMYWIPFSVACEKVLEVEKEQVGEFLRQLTFLEKFENPHHNEFLLSAIPELFANAIYIYKYNFCRVEKSITLGEMGKQVSLYLGTITTKASEVFQQKSPLRRVMISEVYSHFEFVTEFLGSPEKEKDIEEYAQNKASKLNRKWKSCEVLENDVAKIEERFHFLLEKIAEKSWKIKCVDPIQHFAKMFFRLKDPHSKEERRLIHLESKRSLFDLCVVYLSELSMRPCFSTAMKEDNYLFYPQFDKKLVVDVLSPFPKKITNIINGKNTDLPKKISLVLEEASSLYNQDNMTALVVKISFQESKN